MGSSTEYSVQAQLRYIVQWFHEWSEMQRGDFLPVLAQKFVTSGYVNGLVTGLDNLACSNERPPSLFQCRVKLFKEWSDGWGPADRDQLLSQIKAVDPEFVTKFDEEIKSISNVGEGKLESNQSVLQDGEQPIEPVETTEVI